MKKDQLRIPDYLGHILQAIQRIHAYAEDMDEVSFLKNEMAQDAVIRNIEIIGEAACNIGKHYPEFAGQYPDIPWEDVYLMRNRISHGYFSIDLEVVWKTVQHDIPQLALQIQALQQGLNAPTVFKSEVQANDGSSAKRSPASPKTSSHQFLNR